MNIQDKEILRYLGFRGHSPDVRTAELLAQVKAKALQVIAPKSLYREVTLQKLADGETVIGGIRFKSQKLQSHLQNADRILVFAATLGTQADAFVRQCAVDDMAKAAVAQAVLAAATESYCDEVCADIAREEAKNGYYLRPRFSPGYADLPLVAQRDLFSLLEISKRIGVTLNDACLMTPTKSVTAFIGLTKEKTCNIQACAGCDKIDCTFRKEA